MHQIEKIFETHKKLFEGEQSFFNNRFAVANLLCGMNNLISFVNHNISKEIAEHELESNILDRSLQRLAKKRKIEMIAHENTALSIKKTFSLNNNLKK